MKLRRGRLYVIDWDDAVAGETGWNPAKNLKADRARSVGWCVGVTENEVTLVADGSATKKIHKDHVNRPMTIPVGMIRRVREVRLSECRRVR
jgi:hypothetical protein